MLIYIFLFLLNFSFFYFLLFIVSCKNDRNANLSASSKRLTKKILIKKSCGRCNKKKCEMAL